MEKRVCLYCGTVYPDGADRCPLCNGTALEESPEEAFEPIVPEQPPVRRPEQPRRPEPARRPETPERRPEQRRPAERPQKQEKRSGGAVPLTLKILIGVVLTFAVIVLIIFGAFKLGLFGSKKKPADEPKPDDKIELPLDAPDENEVDLSVCTAVKLDNPVILLTEAGQSEQIVVLAQPAGYTGPVSFKSNDTEIATVNSEGVVLATGPGQTLIDVACGEQITSCQVVCQFTVEPETPDEPEGPAQPEEPETPDEPDTPEELEEPETPEEPAAPSYSLNLVDFTLTYRGETARVRVNGVTDEIVTWTSDNSSIATIDGTGLVTAVGNGTTKVRASVAGKEFSCIVRCNLGASAEVGDEEGEEGEEPTVRHQISHYDVTLKIDESFLVELSNTEGALDWVSDNTDVATVNSDGTVIAVGVGRANISVTIEDKTYTCIVRVKEA